MARRIDSQVERPAAVTIRVNGEKVQAYPGESLAAALLAAGITVFNHNRHGEPRAPLCNMGTCFECLVGIEPDTDASAQAPADTARWVRACMTPVRAGMRLRAGADFCACAPPQEDAPNAL